MKKLVLCSLAFLAATLLAPVTHAAVVISNLDPSGDFYTFTIYQIGQATLISNRPISLSSVQFSQSTGDTTANETFAVYDRNANGTVGNLEFSSFSLTYDATAKITTAQATTAFTLQANTGYFFVLTTSSTSNVEWDYTESPDYDSAYGVSLPATNDSFYRTNATATPAYFTINQGVQEFQVNGTALAAVVPEPSTWAMLGAGAVGAGFVTLRRRRVQA